MKYLRPAFLFLLMLIAQCIAQAKTKTITITQINGDGTNGWNRVTERHQESADGSTHSLTCSDPGNAMCQWTVGPRVLLVGYAEQQIAAGTLTGTHTTVQEGIVYFVEWEGTDINNYQIVETQTDNTEPGDGDGLE